MARNRVNRTGKRGQPRPPPKPQAGTTPSRLRLATPGSTPASSAGMGYLLAGRAGGDRGLAARMRRRSSCSSRRALAIIPLAGLMGQATEQLAHRLGPGIGGLLNATFGNAAELIIALFALSRGSTRWSRRR